MHDFFNLYIYYKFDEVCEFLLPRQDTWHVYNYVCIYVVDSADMWTYGGFLNVATFLTQIFYTLRETECAIVT